MGNIKLRDLDILDQFSLNIDLKDEDSVNVPICPECKTENPENAKFCLNCGKELVIETKNIPCPNCGAENPTEAKFCLECGNNLNELYSQSTKKSTESKPFNPEGTLNDFKSDIDLLKKFAGETTAMINSKTISVPKDENVDASINSKIIEIEDEINVRKKDLDLKLKVLSSDLIIVILVKDENNPYSFTFNINVDEDELNRYLEFYKNKEYGSTITTENYVNVESEEIQDNEDFKVDWRDKCPVCKSSKLISRVHKGTFGLSTKNTLECDNCGAIFEEKSHKYKLKKVNDVNSSLWKKYRNQTLKEEEWTRIANGGVSDAEKRRIDKENQEREKRELEALKEHDINEFLTNLQNGTINVSTTDYCPVILKKNEEPSIIMGNVSLLEPRAVRQTVGAYGGPTIRVAKGVSFRMGRMAHV